MTREEAQQAALYGEKITHEFFSKNEYVTVTGHTFFDENDYELDWDDFWNIRSSERWQNDWKIYKP
jgi:hypothetical protein